MFSYTRAAYFLLRSGVTKFPKLNAATFKTNVHLLHSKMPLLCSCNMPAIRHLSSKNLPSFELLRLPSLSPTMETGTVVSWAKKEGDYIEDGDLLAEVETDKATIGFEVVDGGYIAKIFVKAGEKNVPLGTPMCILVKKKEDIEAFKDYTAEQADIDKPKGGDTKSADTAPPSSAASTPSAQEEIAETSTKKEKTVLASNRARKLAAELGIDLANVKGSGPKGRIVAEDVESFAKAGKAGAGAAASKALETETSETISVSDVVNRYARSKTQIPHYYLTVDVEVDEINQLCSDFNKKLKNDAHIQLIDLIIKASALSCLAVPDANSVWRENSIRRYKSVDINFGGKIVKDTEKLNLREIRKELDGASETAAIGGSFAIKQLNSGVSSGAEIIDPSHSCVLTFADQKKVVLPAPAGTRVASVVSFTLSCDHRVVDGANGAQWLQHFKNYLEHPSSMLL